MPEPLVVRMIREFKAGLLLREELEMRAMAAHWLDIERTLESQTELLAREVAAEKAASGSVSQAHLLRMERYQTLLAQTQRQTNAYAEWADSTITAAQREYARLGLEQAFQAIGASYTASVGAYFNRLPVSAVETMAGLLGDGTPLSRLLAQSWPDAADGLTKALLRGTALGWNPNKTARAMREGMATGLDRALTIARTEQLRAYRESSRMQYDASGVVIGYRRLAARDTRTCIACLLTDGEWYETSETLRDHVAGRCGMIPVVRGAPKPIWQQGPAWFRQQDSETQQAIMGREYYRGWQRGEFRLEEMATIKRDSVWGDSVAVRPLRELRRQAETAV